MLFRSVKIVVGLVVGAGLWVGTMALDFPPVFRWLFFGYAVLATVVFLILDAPNVKPMGGVKALGALLVQGMPMRLACAALSAAKPAPGRMEVLGGPPGKPWVVIDYAHTPDALQRVLARDKALLIDVREPGEYAREHITGAQLLPLSAFDISQLPRKRMIVLCCQSGARSTRALARLHAAGFKEIAHLDGGLSAWKAARYATSASALPPARPMHVLPIICGVMTVATGLLAWLDRKSTRLNSRHSQQSRMPSSA